MSLPNEWHLIGPPGTGKTTRLATRWIPRMVELYGPKAVAVVSLTRAAAKEIASRPGLSLPHERVSTLHSLARRALTDLQGVPELAQTPESLAEWNEGPAAHNPLLLLSGASARGDEGLSAEAVVSAAKGGKRTQPDAVTGDGQLARIEVLRQRLVPESDWPADLVAFWRVWSDWKVETQRMDFTDLIALALEREAPLPELDGVAVAGLIVDEAQDCTDLEMALVRSWGTDLEMLALAGDPNQCQPAGTMVLMQGGGSKPIEELRAGDRVVSYHTGSSEFRGLRSQGRVVEEVAARPYMGTMLELHVGDRSTRCTPEHRVVARSTARPYWCLYLMQRGSSFRVGIARSTYPNGYGLVVRSRAEKADRAWLLNCYATEAEARYAEAWTQAQFGLTGMMFVHSQGGRVWSQQTLDQLHASLDSERGAAACLRAYGRRAEFPIWTKGQRGHAISRKSFVTQACNVVPGFFEMRAREGWSPVRVTRHQAVEPVYSLKVQPTEGGRRLYVADGIVVHNSIYGFRGAARGAFHPLGFPEERTEVLRQSYRVAKPVQEYAERLSERAHTHVPVEYAPREDAGAAVLRPACSILGRTHGAAEVAALADREVASLAACDGDHRRVMILASAGFLLRGVLKELRKRGLVYHNPFAPTRGDWNPMRTAHRHIGSFFVGPRPDLVGEDGPGGREPRLWTWAELEDWVSCCAAKGLLRKGAKTHLLPEMVKHRPTAILDPADLDRVFADAAWVRSYLFPQVADPYLEGKTVEWLADAWTPAHRKRLDFPLSVARHSVAKLIREPRIVVGTIHSVKGGTAGAVILAPDLSQRHAREMRRSLDGHDELIRMAYVGATRASTRLYLLRPCTKYRRMRQYLDL